MALPSHLGFARAIPVLTVMYNVKGLMQLLACVAEGIPRWQHSTGHINIFGRSGNFDRKGAGSERQVVDWFLLAF